MRKITPEQKERILRRIRIRKRKDRQRRLRANSSTKTRFLIRIPESFSLDADARATLECLGLIQDVTLKRREWIFIDFSECRSISPGAALILAAEVERVRILYGHERNRISGNYPKYVDVEQTLVDIGFFKHLNLKERRQRSEVASRSFMQIRSGTRNNAQVIAETMDLVFRGRLRLDTRIAKVLLRALIEAMTNVSSHAYIVSDTIRPELPSLRHNWWIVCYRDDTDGAIGAYVYDQGVGIPATVPFRYGSWLKNAKASLGIGNADADMIYAAMEVGRSRTKLRQQGKGMADVRRLIDEASDGRLTITSGGGRLTLEKANGAPDQSLETLKYPLRGTLVSWKLPLNVPNVQRAYDAGQSAN